ncbi:predicted protein [Histoplasma mississippiense (nom. inval.)]|uniref:predicted protein n=1 Tax=Ajellomyces capsulatus (strain NAm1 / WU24) TaxID=2059318 RepID=UPI000157BFB6|nr:predicted protein [Histoplasma mississippiense (nom. inval.)]EDN07031.1 predicted protein [Histoplasma mississippiense (nom. inval.)]
MYPNISYALLSVALIVLSMVHLILLTVHRPKSHCSPEISIFVLFICVNAVVIGISLSGLRCGDTPAFYYPLGICTAFPLALEMIRLSKIQAGPLTNALLHQLFLGYCFLSPAVKLELILRCALPPVLIGLCSLSGLVHDWPLWIEKIKAVISIYYPDLPILSMGIFTLQNKDIKAKGSSTNIFRPYMIFFTSWSGEGTIEYTNGLDTATSKVILSLREMDKDLTSGQQTWVNRAIKCCYCEGTGSAVNGCQHHPLCFLFTESGWEGGRSSIYLRIPRAQDSQQLVQPISKGGILEISLVVQSAKHSHSSSDDYPDIRGDVCRGDENAPLTFIVSISEPVLQERLEYLKAHTFHLQRILHTFSENRVDGPLALPYALCLVKILRQHAGQQLSVKRLDDTIQFLSTRLRGLLSTPLLYTDRGRISRASLLLQRQVFHKRQNLPGDLWQRSTVLSFSMDDNLTVTLFLTNHPYFKVPDEIWNGVNSLDSGIADVAVMFGVG